MTLPGDALPVHGVARLQRAALGGDDAAVSGGDPGDAGAPAAGADALLDRPPARAAHPGPLQRRHRTHRSVSDPVYMSRKIRKFRTDKFDT